MYLVLRVYLSGTPSIPVWYSEYAYQILLVYLSYSDGMTIVCRQARCFLSE